MSDSHLNDWQSKIKNAQNLLSKIMSTNKPIPLDEIKREITDTLSPIDNLTKSKYWKTIQSHISNLIENANKINELLKILNELHPYIEFELKKEYFLHKFTFHISFVLQKRRLGTVRSKVFGLIRSCL